MPRSDVIVRLTGNNQVSIPKRIREQLGLKLGDFLAPSVEHGAVVLRPKVLVDPGREAYLASKNPKNLSPIFDTIEAGVAYLTGKAERRKPPVARRPRKK